jgi:hypothetical protein
LHAYAAHCQHYVLLLSKIDAASMLFPPTQALQLYILKAVNIQCLLTRCVALEGHHLEGIHGFRSLDIAMPNPRTIGVNSFWKHNNIILL